MNMKSIEDVKGIQVNLQKTFETPHGEEVMKFLEQACGWYESVFDPVNKDMVLVNAGRREVLATIKTLLKLTPEQVIALVQAKEGM